MTYIRHNCQGQIERHLRLQPQVSPRTQQQHRYCLAWKTVSADAPASGLQAL